MGNHDHAEEEWINHDPAAEVATLAEMRREREILELRIGGASYVEIGDHYGLSARDVSRIVDRAIKSEVPTELRDHVRALTLARMDILMKRNMIRLVSPTVGAEEQERAEDRVLKITDRIMDITGARAPVQVDVTNHDALDEEIAILVQDLTRAVPPRPDVAPPVRGEDNRINPDLSARSGRWQGRMHRTDRDHGYDDPSVP